MWPGNDGEPDEFAVLRLVPYRLRVMPGTVMTGLRGAARELAAACRAAMRHGPFLCPGAVTARLSGDDLVFVLAHELLHLALRTHDRARGSATLEFNYAHDYIINDMLRHALGSHIVITASMAGFLPLPGCAIYCTTKFAVRGLAECLQLDLAPQGIGV